MPDELRSLETKIGIPVPTYLCDWLLTVGYGDIDEELSFREEWFAPIEKGQLKGGARFAQDILGNFYAFDSSGRIYFLSRSEPVFAAMSKDFLSLSGSLSAGITSSVSGLTPWKLRATSGELRSVCRQTVPADKVADIGCGAGARRFVRLSRSAEAIYRR
ncbi:hypothetical protein ACFSUI_12410 [Ralstonia solanacearum]